MVLILGDKIVWIIRFVVSTKCIKNVRASSITSRKIITLKDKNYLFIHFLYGGEYGGDDGSRPEYGHEEVVDCPRFVENLNYTVQEQGSVVVMWTPKEQVGHRVYVPETEHRYFVETVLSIM